MAWVRVFWDRLFVHTGDRDGQSEALQQDALAMPPMDTALVAERPAAPSHHRRPGPRPEQIILESLALKVLDAWLQNRHQTLFPLTMNLRVLDPPHRALMVHVMAAAAEADGTADEEERGRIMRALDAMGAGEAEKRLLPEAVERPRPLSQLLREAQEAGIGAHAYAASLLAIDQRSRVNQAWLDYLAARLALPADVVNGLNRRYRA